MAMALLIMLWLGSVGSQNVEVCTSYVSHNAGHAAGTSGGAANTANIGLSSAPSQARRIGALGYTSDVAASNSLSAADTLVVAGVRGTDNSVAGSGGGRGSGSGSIGSNRGYSSTGKKRVLLQGQIDTSQRMLRPAGHVAGTSAGAANTANIGLSSAPSQNRRIGTLGYTSDVAASNSLSAADTLVVAGVRGSDNRAAGSGAGIGPGSGAIGSNRGYSSAGHGLGASYPGNNRAYLSGQRHLLLQEAAGTQRRLMLQRSSVGAHPKGVGGTSTSLMGSDRSAGSQSRADVSTGIYGTGSGSSGSEGSINMGHRRALRAEDQLDWFRRGPARAQCAEQQAKTWRPAIGLYSVDTGALLQRVAGKSPLTVMTDAASEMNS